MKKPKPRFIGRLIDTSFDRKGKHYPRFYILIPEEAIKDPRFKLQMSQPRNYKPLLITLSEDGKVVVENP